MSDRGLVQEDCHDHAYRELLKELLFQLADDDLLMGFHDGEWLGLAPHIEEDVAFGSIGQEELGHAALYFRMLEDLGIGRADDLASLRTAAERRNSVLLEQPNGAGHYLSEPHYDWAWTIVRHYYHDVWEIARLKQLQESRFIPLAQAAQKIVREKRYHRAHHELWIRTMAQHDEDSRERLQKALALVGSWAGDLATFGVAGDALELSGVIGSQGQAQAEFSTETRAFLGTLAITPPTFQKPMNGRSGEHGEALAHALATISEVYRIDPAARW